MKQHKQWRSSTYSNGCERQTSLATAYKFQAFESIPQCIAILNFVHDEKLVQRITKRITPTTCLQCVVGGSGTAQLSELQRTQHTKLRTSKTRKRNGIMQQTNGIFAIKQRTRKNRTRQKDFSLKMRLTLVTQAQNPDVATHSVSLGE